MGGPVVVIPAAGEGTRLRPLTYTRPKHLIPLMGRALIEYALDKATEIGAKDIIIVVWYRAEDIQKHLSARGYNKRYNLKYVRQRGVLGTADAVYTAVQQANLPSDTTLAVILGDNIFLESIREHYEEFESKDYDVYLVLYRVPNANELRRYGVAVVEGGLVKRIVEKPRAPPSNLAITGAIFIREAKLVTMYYKSIKPSNKGEYYLTELIQKLITKGYRVGYGVLRENTWIDIGTPTDILRAIHMLLDNTEKPRIEGKVMGEIESNKVVVEKGAIVEGKVTGPAYIGSGVFIGRNAEIKYTDIEQNTRIESGIIEDSYIIGGCTINTGRITIVNSVFGYGCEIRINQRDNRKGKIELIAGDKLRLTYVV